MQIINQYYIVYVYIYMRNKFLAIKKIIVKKTDRKACAEVIIYITI